MKGKGSKFAEARLPQKIEQVLKTLHSCLGAYTARTRLWRRRTTFSAPCVAPTVGS